MPIDFTKTADLVRKLITAARDGDADYEPRPPAKMDWGLYDMAQTREIADTLELTRRLVDAAEERLLPRVGKRARRRGRPPTPAADIAKVLIMQTYFGVPNRVAESLLLLFGEKLGISREFSYKTIERGYDRAAVNRILDEVVALTNAPVQGLEKVFAPDGTGMPASGKENYAEKRAKQSEKNREAGGWPDEVPSPKSSPGGRVRQPVFGAGMIGVRSKLWTAWKGSCDPHVGELAHFGENLARTKALHPEMEMVTGDGAYAGRPQCRLVAEVGAVPRFLPRRNATLKREGVKAWMDMLLAMAEDPQRWFGEYYQREAVETGNSMTKNRKGPLRKKLDARKETETYLRFVQHNVRRLAQLRWLWGLDPTLGRAWTAG